jgi:hypothetical protein
MKIKITPASIKSLQNKTRLEKQRIPRKYSSTWKLSNTFLKTQWVMKVKREELKKFLESNENENTTYQNLWYTAKAMLRGKFIVLSV